MNPTRMLTLGILATSGLLWLSACQPAPSGQPGTQSKLPEALLRALEPVHGSGPLYHSPLGSEPGASLAVHIDSLNQPFGIQSSADGEAAAQASDILAYRVFVVDSASPPSGALTPLAGRIVTVPANGLASQTIVFSNLGQGSYYACAAAFEVTSGFSSSRNLGDALTASTSYAEGPSFCSSSGGGAQPGQVLVDSARQLTTPGVVGITLQLRGARGASLDTEVTVIDGL